ncbi:hypothetical protein [Pseudomonas versuta]|uniref:Uncharacterized protein n=1 Tax=Pseudomonas versuta TaxID=1788301 RepID=A0A854A7B0_9PSED|nr:hypothetical protein [Pseudomonas versuta]OKA29161.1 hypothetical protein BOH74_01015 [Pseudomonas versuta]
MTIVTHTTDEPALFGAMAAVVAHRQQGELLHLPSEFAPQLGPPGTRLADKPAPSLAERVP